MGNPLKIHVYRVSEREYGVGVGEKGCSERGLIVETWPISSPEDAKFVATHGTAYWKASDKVSRLADLIHEILMLDPTFLEIVVTDKEQPKPVEVPKPRKSWFSWFRTAGEST